MKNLIDADRLVDLILSHGYGEPTVEGFEKAAELIRSGSEYAEAAAEVVTLGLVEEN